MEETGYKGGGFVGFFHLPAKASFANRSVIPMNRIFKQPKTFIKETAVGNNIIIMVQFLIIDFSQNICGCDYYIIR